MKNISDDRILEFIEGKADPDLERLINEDPEIQLRYDQFKELLGMMANSSTSEVPSTVGANFHKHLESRRSWSNPFMQIAAAIVLLVVGFSMGRYTPQGSSELVIMRQEIQVLKDIALTSALQNYTASERILAVSQIEAKTETPGKELVQTLVKTLNGDESANVRYAALQALKKFISHDQVRYELVKSLEFQKDPLIQISLITILVEAEERSAIVPLQEIIDNEVSSPEVKQQAEIALAILI